MPDPKPLSGVRVLDMGRMFAAPWAAQILGDLGADVVKVERVTGDEMRHYGPPYLADPEGNDLKDSAYTVANSRNKRSVALDLGDPDAVEVVRRLVAVSDVVLENFKVGDLARRGLDYESLKAVNPDLIYCSVTGFGQTGPYAQRPAVDAIAQAMSGMMSVTGEPDGEPQKVGVVLVDMITGLYAAISVLAALRHREVNGGPGQSIDLALLDTAIASMSHRATEYLLTGQPPKRRGNGSAGNVPANVFECADGKITVQSGGETQFANLCRVLDRKDLLEDSRFNTRKARAANEAVLMEILADIYKTRTVADWVEALVEGGVYCAPIYDVAQAFADRHVQSRDLLRTVRHPIAGDIHLIASPMRFSETPVSFDLPPPAIGEHTDEILTQRLGMTIAEIQALRDRGVLR